jgi:CheY-like chemotaxis protein
VEPDPTVRRFLERALQQTEAIVLVAEHAEAALATVATVMPNLILVNLALPGLSGLDLARRLRHDPDCQAIKLVALTRLCGPVLVETLDAAGFDAHVEMPATVAELGAVLRRLLAEEDRPGPGKRP